MESVLFGAAADYATDGEAEVAESGAADGGEKGEAEVMKEFDAYAGLPYKGRSID